MDKNNTGISSDNLYNSGNYAPNFVLQGKGYIVERLFRENKITFNEMLILMENSVVWTASPGQNSFPVPWQPVPSLQYYKDPYNPNMCEIGNARESGMKSIELKKEVSNEVY